MSLAAFLWLGLGCGGAQQAADRGKIATGKTLTVVGVISVRGASPADFVLLTADDRTEFTLQPSDLTRELARLDNVRVSVEGMLQVPSGGGPILLEASGYRILSLENGLEPMVGWVMVRSGGCFLKSVDGPEWTLIGDLAALLAGFDGAKVWVIGERTDRSGAERQLEVEGYGILAER